MRRLDGVELAVALVLGGALAGVVRLDGASWLASLLAGCLAAGWLARRLTRGEP